MRIKNLSLILIIFVFLIKPVFANFDVNARTAIVQDYLSGKILFEKDADRQIFPASMTKIMTSIIAFDLLKSGELSLDDKFFVSEKVTLKNINKCKTVKIVFTASATLRPAT